eukprot:4014437-Heterocapsa_arctica.AAC.1
MQERVGTFPIEELDQLPDDLAYKPKDLVDIRMYDKFNRTLLRMLRQSRECPPNVMETNGYVLVYDLLVHPLMMALAVTLHILYHLTTLTNSRGLCRVEVHKDRLAVRAKWGHMADIVNICHVHKKLTPDNSDE